MFERPSGSFSVFTISAMHPTVPRAISISAMPSGSRTMPKRLSFSRQSAMSCRYRGSKMCSGTAVPGNRTSGRGKRGRLSSVTVLTYATSGGEPTGEGCRARARVGDPLFGRHDDLQCISHQSIHERRTQRHDLAVERDVSRAYATARLDAKVVDDEALHCRRARHGAHAAGGGGEGEGECAAARPRPNDHDAKAAAP